MLHLASFAGHSRSITALRGDVLVLCIVFALLLSTNALVLAESPNVVILFTDDQGTVDANCYGSTDLPTPNIDKLAATGIRFT